MAFKRSRVQFPSPPDLSFKMTGAELLSSSAPVMFWKESADSRGYIPRISENPR
jgi:hypothetical protein